MNNWFLAFLMIATVLCAAIFQTAEGEAEEGNPSVVNAPAVSARSATALDIPVNTWIAREMPTYGEGPSCGQWGCKHMRLTHNPLDGLIYFMGGDYAGPTGYDSGRNEVYTYDIATDQWNLAFPYCGPPGTVQPSHPDEVGWVFDTNRHIFWMVPGYMGEDQGHCSSDLIRGEIMSFDPAAGTWDFPGRTAGLIGSQVKFAQYDPVNDTIIRFYFDGGAGNSSLVYDIKTDTWTAKTHGHDSNGVDVSDARLGKEYSAIDLENRHIYLIEPVQAKLYRYDMDTQELRYLADAPAGAQQQYNTAMPVWDSVNKVLFYPQIDGLSGWGLRFHVYHPDTNTWETDIPINQPQGIEVAGNHAVFDPYQNVLLLLGGSGGGGDSPKNPYLFLYRYGDGTPGSRDTLPPSPPGGLKISQ